MSTDGRITSSLQEDKYAARALLSPRLGAMSVRTSFSTSKALARRGWDWSKIAAAEAWSDVRTARWRSASWLLVPCWQTALLSTLVIVPSIPTTLSEYDYSACRPDGSFSPWGPGYNPWTIHGFFQITLTVGTLTFTQAKVIDVVWDVGVGRGGQALLALISWKVFSTYLRSSMVTRPTNYQTFWTVFMRDEASLSGIVHMIRDSMRTHALQSKLAVVFIIYTMAFVLAFPTLVSAMSGYTSKVGAFVRDGDSNLIQFSQFALVAYIIHDGWRVGLSGDYPVTYATQGDPVIQPGTYYSAGGDCEDTYYDGEGLNLCYLQRNVSDYVFKYGFLGLLDNETQWMNKTLSKPSLNISAYYLEHQDEYNYDYRYGGTFHLAGYNWTNPKTGTQPYANTSTTAFTLSNTTYPLDDIIANGDCQPLGSFVWGFSFLQLFIALLLLQVWTIGLFSLYLKSRLILKHNGIAVPSKYKAAVELADAMQNDLADIGIKVKDLSNNQLHRHISELKGGRVDLQDLSPTKYSMLSALKKWIKREKWWLGLLGLLCSFDISAWTFVGLQSFYWTVVCWTLGVAISMALATTQNSRAFMSLCGVVVGVLFGLILLAYY